MSIDASGTANCRAWGAGRRLDQHDFPRIRVYRGIESVLFKGGDCPKPAIARRITRKVLCRGWIISHVGCRVVCDRSRQKVCSILSSDGREKSSLSIIYFSHATPSIYSHLPQTNLTVKLQGCLTNAMRHEPLPSVTAAAACASGKSTVQDSSQHMHDASFVNPAPRSPRDMQLLHDKAVTRVHACRDVNHQLLRICMR